MHMERNRAGGGDLRENAKVNGGDEKDWEIAREKRWRYHSGAPVKKIYRRDPAWWTVLYISNFPDECSVEDLWRVFNKYGIVRDVYIARRRNGVGDRFGFVKYGRVNDKANLEANLNNLKFGNLKLMANRQNFDRDRNPVGQNQSVNPNGNHKVEKRMMYVPVRSMNARKSFADAVGNMSRSVSIPKVKSLCFVQDEVNDKVSWNRNSVVARAKNLSTLQVLPSILSGMGITCTVRYVGGFYVLLTFNSFDLFVSEKNKYEEYIDSVEVWVGQALAVGRIANLEVMGLPPNIWDKSLFNMIGKLFGDVVMEPVVDDGIVNLACGNVLIHMMGCEMIREHVNVEWNGNNIKCLVKESIVSWSPDFTKNVKKPVDEFKIDHSLTAEAV